jgi:hypothetical protein
MRDERYRMQDTGFKIKMLDAGYRMKRKRCWMRDSRCWIHDNN